MQCNNWTKNLNRHFTKKEKKDDRYASEKMFNIFVEEIANKVTIDFTIYL